MTHGNVGRENLRGYLIKSRREIPPGGPPDSHARAVMMRIR